MRTTRSLLISEVIRVYEYKLMLGARAVFKARQHDKCFTNNATGGQDI